MTQSTPAPDGASSGPGDALKREYHRPALEHLGSLGDMTAADAPITPIDYDSGTGYTNAS
jgi:hypothetical protein